MRTLPDPLPILPFTRPVRGHVTLPGSKSITNRALILAALGSKKVTLHGALFSRDTQIMVAGLRSLGFAIVTDEKALTVTITGQGGKIPAWEATIDVGNAGTAARFLTALVCLRPDGIYNFDGDEAMRRRPIGALLEALESQGATASARAFPFTLKTAGLVGGTVELDASESSQMLSALLMVAPYAKSPLHVQLKGAVGSKPFVRMTEEMVKSFHHDSPSVYPIEPDASAASYYLALPCVAGGEMFIGNLPGPGKGLQGDTEFLKVLGRLGATEISLFDGNVTVRVTKSGHLHGVSEDFRQFSDTFLTLAAIAPLLKGATKITGIEHTRKQETDRVAGMARELRKLGQDVVETEDSLTITPQPLTSGVEIETYHDHRFAMSFGILGCHDLHGNGQPWLRIKDPGCCAKTFPNFFELLESLRRKSLTA
ncbi:MAG: 3-phosphoshikimate 1-carboxyvinyltransferase [Opitutaceae bacterium]